MRRLGISIYPEKSTVGEIKAYLEKAYQIGARRVFSCLLSVEKDVEAIKEEFKSINDYAKQLGYEVILDVNPKVFSKLGVSYQDLSLFKELNSDGVRLDMGFTGSEEALMTFNPYDLKIEINMSNDTHTIDTIMDYQPNRYNLIGCHNFYPHAYSGLSLDHFERCTRRFMKYGLRTAAFVGSLNSDSYGPWPVTQGLCTLEMHRTLPLHIQVKHYVQQNMIDDIIISNCFPSNEELKQLSRTRLDVVTYDVELVQNIPDVEKAIVLEELHFNRGDQNPNMIRSTQSRVKYRGHQFELFNAPEIIHKGDIIIESSDYGHYAGELQIALNDMINSGKSNVVGRIVPQEQFLLDELKPWQKFRMQLSEE